MGTNMKCPKCALGELITQTHDGIAIDICTKCNGIWLHKGELNKMAHPQEGDLEFCSTEHIDEDRISDCSCPQM